MVSPRVLLHVGSPKSGTTFLQGALWANRDALADNGIHLPGARQRQMFLAAVEMREGFEWWGYPAAQIGGTWERLCAEAKARNGTTIMSHELLGACSAEQARRALGALDDVELHVVITARDLARQATSEWQERVKNGSTRSFTKFHRAVKRHVVNGTFSSNFWRNQDVVGVLDRWAADLAPERVHVVVAPPPGAGPLVLWERFAAAAGFDPDLVDATPSGPRVNEALGVAQVAALRHVNLALDGRIPQPGYARVVKDQYAVAVLAAQEGQRPQAPRGLTKLLREVAQERNDTIRSRGYQVHGDLDELIPRQPHASVAPDDVEPAAVIDALAASLAQLLVERNQHRTTPAPEAANSATPRGSSLRSRLRRRR